MSKPLREPRHVRLYHWLLESPAYQSLDVYGRALLVEFKKRYNSVNNGNIAFSGKEMEAALSCSNKPADRALSDLIDRGFVKVAKKGHFDWKRQVEGGSRANTWILTEYPIDYPTHSAMPATKDFMKWRPAKALQKKTRGDESTAMGGRRHRIPEGMGGREHPNGVTTAPDMTQKHDVNGGTRAPPYSIPGEVVGSVRLPAKRGEAA
ncbi:hypothetical protein NKH10_17725 [Mesorhizobium sp. M1340]|uniref:hypothetical protein n=1 Tax=unclassified Mesorhizobium TaxID=325217 RepID=UPI00333D9624